MMDLPLNSPRATIVSPGLTHRGKTPRSSGLSEEHTHFQFNEFGFDRQPSIPEEATYNNDKDQKPFRSPFYQSPRQAVVVVSPVKRFLLGASVSAALFGVLLLTGFFRGHHSGTSAAVVGRTPGLRGATGDYSTATNNAKSNSNSGGGIGSFASSIFGRSAPDHHKPRVLIVPSNLPFKRRNIHHYTKHDSKGRLIPDDAIRSKNVPEVLHVEDALEVDQDPNSKSKSSRRSSTTSAADVVRLGDKEEQDGKYVKTLPLSFLTTGVVSSLKSITGVSQQHHFDINEYFGSSVTKMRQDPQTNKTTVAVGAPGASDNAGMLYFLTLANNGQLDSYSYLSNIDDAIMGEFWTSNAALGWTVENIGDLDGDGVNDIAVGAIGYPHGSSMGAVYILFLTPENEIKDFKVITTGMSGFESILKDNSCFGSSIANVGDLDGDGVPDLAVGAMGLGKQRGGIYILHMNKDGTVKKSAQISSMYGWEHKLNVEDQFGHAVRAIGDLDGDGVTELAVGGDGFPSGEFYGSLWILFLTAEGKVKKWRRVDELDGQLQPESLFGGSIEVLGDLDGDGLAEIIVGAPGANDFKGDAFIISLNKDATVKVYKSLVDANGALSQIIKKEDEFAWSICNVGDLNGDGVPDLAIGAETSPSENNYGSLHVVFLEPQL